MLKNIFIILFLFFLCCPSFATENVSISLLLKTAQKGSSISQLALGKMYLDGEGVTQNEEKAFQWIKKSVDQRNTDALFMLGEIYLSKSLNKKVLIKKAFDYFRLAAKEKHPIAEFYVGLMYLHGLGAPHSKTKGVHWIRRSAHNGYGSAQIALGRMYHEGMFNVPQNKHIAYIWYKKATNFTNNYNGAESYFHNHALFRMGTLNLEFRHKYPTTLLLFTIILKEDISKLFREATSGKFKNKENVERKAEKQMEKIKNIMDVNEDTNMLIHKDACMKIFQTQL